MAPTIKFKQIMSDASKAGKAIYVYEVLQMKNTTRYAIGDKVPQRGVDDIIKLKTADITIT